LNHLHRFYTSGKRTTGWSEEWNKTKRLLCLYVPVTEK
jgi:hypothetical protein